MRRSFRSCTVLVLLLPAAVFAAAPASLPSLSQPALSPDGREIAFVSGGDIWSVAAAGGEAHLLVSHPATESRPLWSPDGSRLAFVSTRTGNGDIYVLTLATSQLTRITYADAAEGLDAWSADGRWLYFTSNSDDIAGTSDVFRVSAEGGTPLEVSHERYLSEFESAPSPDGKTLALMAKGISDSQWWRNGHAHIDNTELWLKPIDESAGYRVLLPDDAKHAWPMWSEDGATLYYMSDKTGPENLWSASAKDGAEKQLTHFTSGRVLFPSLGNHGRTIVFERDFNLWSYNLGSGKAEKIPVALRGSSAGAGVRHEVVSKFTEMALSPDGKKVALVAHGDVFATTTKDGGDAIRVTDTPQVEDDLHWSPDSKLLVYESYRNGHANLYAYDFTTDKERQLTKGTAEDESPRWSPDGKTLAYVRNEKELHLLTLSDLSDKTLATDYQQDPVLAFSPAGDWIAFAAEGYDDFRNLKVVPTRGGEARPISFLANGESAQRIAWSPDGKYILFETAQRSESLDIARVDLTLHVPTYREDEFRDLFRTPIQPTPKPETKSSAPVSSAELADKGKSDTEKKPEVKPIDIRFDGIRDRLSLLPIGLSAGEPVISPDGKTLVFAARTGNQENLYSYSVEENPKEPPVAKQLTSSASDKQDWQFSPDSKEIYYLDAGQLRRIALEGAAKPIAVTAAFDVDFATEKNAAFEEAWHDLDRYFYDPTFHGRNWNAIHDEWAPYIAGSQTPDEMRRDISLMIGELDSSHSGIFGPDRPAQNVGRLGLRFERAAYENGKGLVVREVVPLGPAGIEGIAVGDRLLAVNGRGLETHTNLNDLLTDTIGRRTVLHVGAADGKERDVVVMPVSTTTEAGLLYRAWIDANRAEVAKLSGGRLGYVHLADMSDHALKQLYLDLDAQNESRDGVVVDVRNNDGGYVNGYALDVFSRRNYLTLTFRGLPPSPSRQILGQRALGKPTILLTNESTLSDGEDFTEGYRALHLGKVVGVPTAGWIIYTGGTELIDGSYLRLPRIRVQDLRGQTMEEHPRPVDIDVVRRPGETETGDDSQIERAVTELLSELPAKK
ncbi:MAG TPA: DPP IV N-terminal domain-containing protein [Acidobacteriaceae bacterium]|nr:DPP IV N-terminal domain-containing protein [Acidobacteriaceae bacterium]